MTTAEWRETERVVLEEVYELTAAVIVRLPDDSRALSGLETTVSLLRVSLRARYLDAPFPAAPADPPDEDALLDAYADRLAVMIEWLPRESGWRGSLRGNLTLLDLLAERRED